MKGLLVSAMAAILFSSVAHSQNIEESGYYALHPELGGTVTILKSEKSVLGKQGITTSGSKDHHSLDSKTNVRKISIQ
jgi:hypothetical protein